MSGGRVLEKVATAQIQGTLTACFLLTWGFEVRPDGVLEITLAGQSAFHVERMLNE